MYSENQFRTIKLVLYFGIYYTSIFARACDEFFLLSTQIVEECWDGELEEKASGIVAPANLTYVWGDILGWT